MRSFCRTNWRLVVGLGLWAAVAVRAARYDLYGGPDLAEAAWFSVILAKTTALLATSTT